MRILWELNMDNVINIDDYDKPKQSKIELEIEWLNQQLNVAYDRLQLSTNQFELDKAIAICSHLQWRSDSFWDLVEG